MTQTERPPKSAPPRRLNRPAKPEPAAELAPWERLFRSAAPDQRAEWLALAAGQGGLFRRQLGAVRPAAPADHARRFFESLAEPQSRADLPGIEPRPLEPFDTTLDARQLHLVARALATPDVFLVAGIPGSGKTRCLAEAARQAVARGESVAYLAGHPASVDHFIALLSEVGTALPLRVLGRGESPEALSPASRAVADACLEDELPRQARERAAETLRSRSLRTEQLSITDTLWEQAEAAAVRHQSLQNALEENDDRQENFDTEFAELIDALDKGGDPPDGDDFASRYASLRDELKADGEKLASDASAAETELTSKRTALQGAESRLAEFRGQQAKREAGGFFARLMQKDRQPEIKQAESEIDSLRGEIGKIETRLEEARKAADAHDGRAEEARLQSAGMERDGRRNLLDEREDEIQADIAKAEAEWTTLTRQLSELGLFKGGDVSADAVRDARRRAEEQNRREAESATFLKEWVEKLEADGKAVAAEYRAAASVIVGPAGADIEPKGGFDLVLIDDADALTEAEVLAAAKSGRRWVLAATEAAQSLDDALTEAEVPRRGRQRGGRGNNKPKRDPVGAFLARTWQALHPVYWRLDGERLCCRLVHLAGEQRGRLEAEPVADLPDVSLCIYAPDDGEPTLAEVHFPASMAIDQAKRYLYQELGEPTITAPIGEAELAEADDRWVCTLRNPTHAADGSPCETRVELEGGVWEVVEPFPVPGGRGGPSGWVSTRLEFMKGAGWDGDKVNEWLADRRALWARRRTARLRTHYRSRPALAEFLSDTFPETVWHRPDGVGGGRKGGPGFEFVAVPFTPRRDDGRGRGKGRRDKLLYVPRVGSGLEIDIGGQDGLRESLPSAARDRLPERGKVNPKEASAVLRRLAALLESPNGDGRYPRVAVTAGMMPQVILLQSLAADSQELADKAGHFAVLPPEAVAGGEFDVVIVSLTRSHPAHAVPYSADPSVMAQLLTRARKHLILVGDPGTLNRRSTWSGGLDHLGETAAGQEQAWVTSVVNALRNQDGAGRHVRAVEGVPA